MLAYVYDQAGKLSLQEKPQPIPREDNAILQVQACSICGTDLRTYLHGSSKIIPPRIVGHEVCGVLIDVGSKITGVSAGERVTVAPAIGCGDCYACSRGYTNLCDNLKTIGFQYEGTFAEYLEIPFQAFKQGNVNKVAEHVADEEAVLAEPIACVVNGQEFLRIEKGDSVAIFGSGFIGCIHAELAFLREAEQVIIIEIARNRAEQAQKLLPHVSMLDPSQGQLFEKITQLTNGKGVNVAITACSSGQAQIDALKVTAKRGRVSLFGGLPGKATGFLDSNLIHYKELAVYGVHASTPPQNKLVLEWIAQRKLNVKKYISRIFALQNIENAFHALQYENIMKAIIKPGESSK
ncbi:alcohol dehydrogenase GroES domain protein [Candidatus Vecturithrix granuli]|uniref:Alcohol dehydrogenase GroES domain protein n=1 Tax=Vecturithrix granuli TaxID=1499967 RepID=A0A081C3Q2_VECG1|nr:alcohol dehydrogenase GroES domain protein [Candidatus Vecturithrix granuli]